MLAIPFDNTQNAFQEQIELDGNTYLLDFQWNDRDSSWYLSIYQIDGTPIIEGMKIVLSSELIAWTRRAGLPPGEFWAVAQDPSKTSIAQTDIPDLVSLIYIPVAEL